MAKRKVKRKSVDRPYAGGTMSVAGRHGFFMGLIRHGLMRWKPKHQCIKNSATEKRTNPDTGRLCMFHRCNRCGGEFVAKNMRADHIEPLVPLTGFDSWDETFARAFVEVGGFQAVCVGCHKEKSGAERKVRDKYKKDLMDQE